MKKASRRKTSRQPAGESRKDALTRHLRENKVHVDHDTDPYRTIVGTKYKSSYDFAVLGDVYGVFLSDGIVMSCPVARLERMARRSIRNYLLDRGVRRIAILGGTNDLVTRERRVTQYVTSNHARNTSGCIKIWDKSCGM